MSKIQEMPRSFECRIDGPDCTLMLNRENMPPQAFEVRLECRNGEGPDVARFACGFSVYIAAGEQPFSIITRIVLRLIRVSPKPLNDDVIDRLRDVADSWILFNFRPSMESAGVPARAKQTV